MKEKYTSPKIMVENFTTENLMTLSGVDPLHSIPQDTTSAWSDED